MLRLGKKLRYSLNKEYIKNATIPKVKSIYSNLS